MSQSIERILQEILTLSDAENLRLFKAVAKLLTEKGLRPLEDIDRESELVGDDAISNCGQSTEQDSRSTLDLNATALKSTSAGSGEKSDQHVDDSTSQFSGEFLETVHRYKILRQLARGGLGHVYVAQDMDLGRDVALKEILIGRPAFQGKTIETILSDIIQGSYPKPREISPNVPSSLEMVCLKAMALRPEDRYQSAYCSC